MMESRADHYLDNPQQQTLNFNFGENFNKKFNRKRQSVGNESCLLSREVFTATSSSKGGCDSKESLRGGRTPN